MGFLFSFFSLRGFGLGGMGDGCGLTWFGGVDRAGVEAFHQAAVAAGGKCNGVPGVRAHYGPTYFATFVLDPVGNNIEALCFAAA